MKNTIKVTIPFSFKGIEHAPSSIIDLDALIQGDQSLHNTFHLVANENKIDNYSYEYEVLESSPKIFSEPTGVAVDFLLGNNFDLEGFKNKIKTVDINENLQLIASEILGIDDLENHQEQKEALLKAYSLGVNSKKE